jgi:hypothetical protein
VTVLLFAKNSLGCQIFSDSSHPMQLNASSPFFWTIHSLERVVAVYQTMGNNSGWLATPNIQSLRNDMSTTVIMASEIFV